MGDSQFSEYAMGITKCTQRHPKIPKDTQRHHKDTQIKPSMYLDLRKTTNYGQNKQQFETF